MEEKYSIEFLKTSHKGRNKNKKELLDSQICGCFYLFVFVIDVETYLLMKLKIELNFLK